MKSAKLFVVVLIAMVLSASAARAAMDLGSFNIHAISADQFRTFVKVFSEMRGPLRSEILKSKKTNFEDADPLAYLAKVKDTKDVKKVMKENDISWDQFNDLMGNILLGYFSIQPDKTKSGLIKQLADYGLIVEDVPPEYRQQVKDMLKTDAGSGMAAAAMEFLIQIPEENKAIARESKRTLDQLFYTKFWADKI